MTGLLLLEMSGMPLKNNGGANITIRSAAEEYGMVIVNEYHHVAASSFEKARKVAKVK